ncbi:phosphatidylinositol-3-phosphate-binding protein BEM1 CYBJADRAFT_123408 [Cyberlindnera jadinii NRRL Y-1542]|uniref:Bud emergence protein 1 n=1 Tax=Cyberlindnera jadinii (strain ATCC 18201 / CBS 1600 / BCRC 20928 / JCM 3617 / NBRC 0987 / NRRL Y-1542) TaxID=983966 RepID=A0A1E4S6S7_CYBJN|nr:hypothetical protein CYBJADRAFT_123408 [Cyberlindnera jadinii NRRL Y-1542]ODV75178.1 hypothetical protein CYBJADRAFT_123408 [Cyberlindnera jadinii NRRL Y-1542]
MASISSINDLKIGTSNLLQSPKKVIKALYDYTPQGPGELAFSKGDFFHVIGNEDDPEWYEACNPSKNQRGMVPVPYFETFDKTRPPTTKNSSSPSKVSRSSKKLSTDSMPVSISSKSSSSNTLYAIVLYDFKAERSDELDIIAGENIILCAHHEYEWFIAKPIDRLGGPGLVPVSYVSVIDILTGNSTGNNVVDDITSANLPTVEQWKSRNAKYKASSIPLGNVDETTTGSPQSQIAITPDADIVVNDSLPYIVDATVDSFYVDNGRYWFHINAELSNGELRSLCRYYEDFYDFQIRLLELFPAEAGRSSQSQKRILPFIPGPLTYVTDKITKKRQVDLNEYVKELVALPVYVSHCNFVKSLFSIKNELDRVLESSNLDLQDDDRERTIVKNESIKTLNLERQPTSQKLKFYYKDDIFALLLSRDTTLATLRKKVSTRIHDEEGQTSFRIYTRIGEDKGEEVLNDEDVQNVLNQKLKMIIEDE